jgi:predicted transcriptional regulator
MGFYATRGQRDRLAELAQRDDRSISALIRRALSDYIAARDKENR